MSIDADDEIRADFLVEAGEIVQRLGRQLIDLEKQPQDRELLNSIFRGFHTVKGGAGFLHLEPVVELCHHAEDVFNALRQGKVEADASRIDSVLQSVSVLESMLEQVTQQQAPSAPPPALLAALKAASSAAAAPAPAPLPAKVPEQPAEKPAEHPAEIAPPAAASGDSNLITDDEFEALLDSLHGKGQAPSAVAAAPAPAAAPAAASAAATKPATPAEIAPAESGSAAVKAGESSVRVDTVRLDRIMNLVGELVLVRNRMKLLRGRPGGMASAGEELDRSVARLDQVTTELQSSAMQLRMQPIGKVFARFPRLMREVARGLGKQVRLELQGEDTDLDKNLVEALADPLVHLVRNAIDHGIEMPERRLKAGKPAEGCLLLAAAQEGDRIVITVRDDGGGMDPEVLRRKAVERGVLAADVAARLSPAECLELIFRPGFSTKNEVSDISGRGVGMDVVKSRITELKGSVTLESKPGAGTTVRISVPLTLAILPALMLRCGRVFAVGLSAINDVFSLDESLLIQMDGRTVLQRNGESLPLMRLEQWLRLPAARARPGRSLVVHVNADGRHCGLVVDEVLGREEIVVKPLGALLSGLPGFSGATITGDGSVALILDLPSLLKLSP